MIRVLHTDDHPFIREVVREMLQDDPDIVIDGVAGTGEEMMELLAIRNFDIVLLDISLPGKSGIDFLPELKEKHPDIPVLMLSAYSDDRYVSRLMNAGAVGYLRKSDAYGKLAGEIRKAVGEV